MFQTQLTHGHKLCAGTVPDSSSHRRRQSSGKLSHSQSKTPRYPQPEPKKGRSSVWLVVEGSSCVNHVQKSFLSSASDSRDSSAVVTFRAHQASMSTVVLKFPCFHIGEAKCKRMTV
ncbi:hypothetical protein T265_05865 [Opisthorchis viverrini]|uniref:Uncharacterized protein n=1 Tax=Opisthorchis viverrini TaxID=6198 RepID=A0A074ZJ69_OPIVI|nr:hypothetical protein T265_05865 [Opisthorchis viverrini]KER27036.1 hypothetical protein T265_05865 [Opisthorchis viverrini]